MATISSITSLTLDLPPSCIAFSPAHTQYFVVGTYYLHPIEDRGGSETASGLSSPDLQKRSGSLILYRLDGDTIHHVQTVPTPGFSILDIQWTPHTLACGSLLAVATSTGDILIYILDMSLSSAQLEMRCCKTICEPSVLVLSLAWHPSQPELIAVTLSDGRVETCETDQGWTFSEETTVYTREITQHDLEAWTLAFAHSEGDQLKVLSGGDDISLQMSSRADGENSVLLWKDRKIHQAGVTAILPLSEDLILTGSYDDHVRLISTPPQGRKRVLTEANLGGGVWRLKILNAEGASSSSASISSPALLDSTRSILILASCMHAGTRILRLCRDRGSGDWSFEVLSRFEEHKSMNYGSDVQPGTGSLKSIVSTSFYDRLLCLWRFDMGAAR